MTYAPPYMAGNGTRANKNSRKQRAMPRCLDSAQGATASPSSFSRMAPNSLPNGMANGKERQGRQYLHARHRQSTPHTYIHAGLTDTKRSS